MAITANVELGNGISATEAYIIIPCAYVKKFTDADGSNPVFRLSYDAEIYQNATKRINRPVNNKILCKEVDHFVIDYDPATSDNPFTLAYTHLKTNSTLSSITDV